MQEIKTAKYKGVIGAQECDKVGQCGRGALILQVKNGTPVVVWSSE
jgi:hypothetical protein